MGDATRVLRRTVENPRNPASAVASVVSASDSVFTVAVLQLGRVDVLAWLRLPQGADRLYNRCQALQDAPELLSYQAIRQVALKRASHAAQTTAGA